MVVANLLVGAITPGQAGGEPVRIHELYKADMPIGDATAVVIMERVLDAVILVGLTIFSLLVMGKVIWNLGEGIVFVIFLSLALLILFVAILIFAAKKPVSAKDKSMRLLYWIEAKMKKPGSRYIITSTDVEFDNFCSGITAFTGHGKKGIIQGSVFSILFWFSEFIVASVILMGLGLPPFHQRPHYRHPLWSRPWSDVTIGSAWCCPLGLPGATAGHHHMAQSQ